MPWSPSLTRRCRVFLPIALLACLAPTGMLWSQARLGPEMPQPRILILSPSGGKAGPTAEGLVTGKDLESPQGLLLSHPGIKAEFVDTSVVKADPPKKGQALAATGTARQLLKKAAPFKMLFGQQRFHPWGAGFHRCPLFCLDLFGVIEINETQRCPD